MADGEERTWDSVDEFAADMAARRQAATDGTETVEDTPDEDGADDNATIDQDEGDSEATQAEDDIDDEPETVNDDDEDAGDEGEADDSPSIDPPQFWDKARKAEFAKLTPELQQVVVEQDKRAQAAVTQAQQQAAEAARQAKQALESYSQRAEKLSDFVTETEATLKTYEKVDWVAEMNSAQTAEQVKHVQAHRMAYEQLQGRLAEAKQEQQKAEQEEYKSHMVETVQSLRSMADENPFARALIDPKDGPENRSKMQNYLQKHGIEPDMIRWLPAAGAVLAMKAMAHDEAVAKAKASALPQGKPQKRPAPRTPPTAGGGQQGSRSSNRLKQLQGKANLSLEEGVELMQLKRKSKKS